MRGLWLSLLVGACAAPGLTLYTLTAPAGGDGALPPGGHLVVVAVGRVTVPDEIDTEDLFVRDGSMLRRSSVGRWASRLSLGVTDRLSERLGERRRDLLVTARPLTETPAYRVLVNAGRLEVSAAGVAVMEADWLVVPANGRMPLERNRGVFTATGTVVTDAGVVALVGGLVDRLAEAIVLPAGPR